MALNGATVPAAAVTVTAADGMVVEVPRQGGEVRLLIAQPSAGPFGLGSLYLLNEAGAWLPLTMADPEPVHVEPGSEPVWRLPLLAAGRWRLIAAASPLEWSAVAAGQGSLLPILASFTVTPGHVTDIEAIFPDGE